MTIDLDAIEKAAKEAADVDPRPVRGVSGDTVLEMVAEIRRLRAGLVEALDCYDEKPGSSEWSGCLCPSSYHAADCLAARIAALRELMKP